MLQSMTAFGKAKKQFSDIEISVEIHSVNKKFLDMQIKLPPEWNFFEPFIRSLVAERIERGYITISVHVVYTSPTIVAVALNRAYAEALKCAMGALADAVGHTTIDPKDLFNAIVREKGVFQPSFNVQENSALQEKLQETLHACLEEFCHMKAQEGTKLSSEFLSRLHTLDDCKQEIQKNSQNASQRYRQKITELLKEFKEADIDNEMRLAKEVALLADKLDISEELSRFGYHIDHCRETVIHGKKAVGKVLEFILQELLREINTIGSKSQDAQIAKLVIQAKSEIEKLKEQVQNIE